MEDVTAEIDEAGTTKATRRARVLGFGTWSVGAVLFGLACLLRSPALFAAFAVGYVVLAVAVYVLAVASRKSQVELARQNAARFRELAIRDDLTGLFNRRHFTAELERQVRQSRDTGLPLCLAMLDLDGFKSINDSFGHGGGDDALRLTAEAMLTALPAGATAARIGGDEFAAILPGRTADDAQPFVKAVHGALDHARLAFPWWDAAGRLQATIGLAALRPGDEACDLLRKADAALYAGKRGQRAA